MNVNENSEHADMINVISYWSRANDGKYGKGCVTVAPYQDLFEGLYNNKRKVTVER